MIEIARELEGAAKEHKQVTDIIKDCIKGRDVSEFTTEKNRCKLRNHGKGKRATWSALTD